MKHKQAEATVYKSKISFSLALYAGAVILTIFVLSVINHIWAMALLMLVLSGFVAHLLFTTTYTISGNKLYIKSGFLYNLEVDITSIFKMSETNNLISSPAASFDRLEIRYNKRDTVLISPQNKMGFIFHLLKLNPNIVLQLKEQQAK